MRHLEKKKLKIILLLWELEGCKSKHYQPGHTGALLVYMPGPRYESCVVVVILSIVERRARRCLKVLIKMHLKYA